MTPEGYLQDLACTLSEARGENQPSRSALPGATDLPLAREDLEGRDLDEVLPNPSTLSASFHGRALRETVERLGIHAHVRWGCGGLPLESLDTLALQVPFGGGVALATPSGLVKFIATLAHVVASPVPAAADSEFVEVMVAAATPGARVKATVPSRSDPGHALASVLRNVAERFALACPLAAAVLEPPRVPLWSTTRLGAGVEVKRLLPEARELMAADIIALRLTSDVEWDDHPGFAVWGIDFFLGGLALVESLQGRPRKAERGFIPALSRRNLMRTLVRQAAGEASERAFELADAGAQTLATLWDRNQDAIQARLQPR